MSITTVIKGEMRKQRFPDTLAEDGIVPPAKGQTGWRAQKGAAEGNKSGLCATGHRVLLLGVQAETETASGLVILTKTAEAEKNLSTTAIVVEIGHDAWNDKSTDYCEVGDTVLVGQYTGMFTKSPVDGKEYRFINDLDIISRISKEV